MTQTILAWLLALVLLIPILLRLYRNLATAFSWPITKDFTDAQEYRFGPDYPRGW